jgi:hypothetical protein
VSRRAELALAVAIAALVVAIRAPLWDLPLERDEGEYAYIAWRMGHGEMPYRDAFDQKPPGVFLAYRLALALPVEDPVAAIRALAALFSAASSLALYAWLRGLLGPAGVPAASWAALLLGFLSADPMIQGPIANSELFMLPGILAAAALLPRAWAQPPRAAWLAGVAVGVLLGVATTMKQVAIVNVPLFVAVVAWRAARGERARRLARFTAAFTLGGLLVWGPLLLWLWWGGALAAGLDAFLLHNLAYAGAPTLADRVAALRVHAGPLLPTQAAAWGLAGVGVVDLLRKRDRFPGLFLVAFAACAALGVSASGRYYPHYFQQLLPAVAAFAAMIAIAPRGSRGRAVRLALPAAALVPLAMTTFSFWRLDPATAMARIYPGNPFEAMPAIAREIAAQSAPDERVFVFGSEPELLFYARRASASRYIHLFPLFAGDAQVRARWDELAGELTATPPAVIALMPNAMTSGGAGTRWLEGFLAQGYRRHAAVVWDDTSRGRLLHLEHGVPAPPLPEGATVWATLWLRRGSEPSP